MGGFIIHLSLLKKSFLNLYLKTTDYEGQSSIVCSPLPEINPDTFTLDKLLEITDALQPCMQDTPSSYYKAAQIIAAKIVDGYILAKPLPTIDTDTPSPYTPYIEDFNCGWVGTGNGVWTYEKPTKSYSDIYRVKAGNSYSISLGDTVGSRFRVMFSTVDVSTVTSGTVTGIAVNNSNYNNPSPFQSTSYSPEADGYIIIQKDNVGTTGIKTYLYCVSSQEIVTYFDIKSTVALSVTTPAKTTYKVGELLDLSGTSVVATFDDGSSMDVTQIAVFSPDNGSVISLLLCLTAAYPPASISPFTVLSYLLWMSLLRLNLFTVKVRRSIYRGLPLLLYMAMAAQNLLLRTLSLLRKMALPSTMT